ncbi:unnamed protein product, partial [marine sediment metagenome]
MSYRHYTRDQFWAVFENMHGTQLKGAPDQDILETCTDQRFEIGSRRQLPAPDNRIFHYCFAPTALGLDDAHAAVVAAGGPPTQFGCAYNS